MALNTPVLTKEEWQRLKENREFNKVLPKSQEGSDWRGLLFRPEGVTFFSQNKGEQVYILLRRHIITNIGWVVNTGILFAVPFIISILFGLIGVNLSDFFGPRVLTVIMLAFYSVVQTLALMNFVNWYFNLFVVTNERVINFGFRAFVSQGVSESDLGAIEDIREESVGFVPSTFHYGNVSMYSTADKNIILFDSVPKPALVRDKVADLGKIAKSRRYT